MDSRRAEGLRRLDREIAAEKAAVLGRAGERLEQALAEVADIARRLDTMACPRASARLTAEYERARDRAAQARAALVIQREAIGLRHHRMVDQQFPEPPIRRQPRDAAARSPRR